jgi:hypothetical protein
MKVSEARKLGQAVGKTLCEKGRPVAAMKRLQPVLESRIPFPTLECIGESIVAERPNAQSLTAMLNAIAATRAMGGWVIIASVLRQQLSNSPGRALAECRRFVIDADVWYGADIFGERGPGTALLSDFDAALARLAEWRDDPNRWVRRALGAGAHHWAKRAVATPGYAIQAKAMLRFLEPLVEEQDTDAIKGIGWGLKTLGKHHPDLVAAWLADLRGRPGSQIRGLMLRKAVTYLDPARRIRALGAGR